MTLQKQKPYRSAAYLKWVRSLPCCVTGRTDGVVAHHITNTKQSGMGTKPSDSYCIPLCQEQHYELHCDPVLWESVNGKQMDHLEKIVIKAIKEDKLPSYEAWIVGLEG